MAISKRTMKDGSVRYQVEMVQTDPVTGKRRRKTIGRYFPKKLAEKKEREAQRDIDAGTFEWEPVAPKQQITVSDACRVWLGTKTGAITENSFKQYESLIRVHIEPAIGKRPIEELTRTEIQALVNAWRDGEPPAVKKLAPRLLELCLMVLRASLEMAVDNGDLAINPAAKVTKPRVTKRKRLELWGDAEAGRFIALAEKDRLAPLWALAMYEGFRRGEALGLRWRDLEWNDDETECIAHIRQTVIADLENSSGPKIQNKAKTEGSEKPVALTAATIRVLKRHRDRQKFLKQEIGEDWTAGDLIVTNSIGGVMWPTNCDHALRKLCDKAGVPPLSIHALRHMAATTMLRAGLSPALVQQKLRHSDIATTVGVYGHLMTNDQQAVNAALDAAVERARRKATDAETG